MLKFLIGWFCAGMMAALAFWMLVQWVLQPGPPVQPNPRVGRASPGFAKQMHYHGILGAYWDWDRGTWVFERDGKTCQLKTRMKKRIIF